MNLFLDDYRNPKQAWIHDDNIGLSEASGIPNDCWLIVRTAREFEIAIERFGIPEVVSYDIDLTEDHMRDYMDACQGKSVNYEDSSKSNGISCAVFLLNTCNTKKEKHPKYYIHSANHLARPVLRKLINEKGKTD